MEAASQSVLLLLENGDGLRRRHESLGAAGKRPCVANVAVARELACWVWEVGRRAEGTLA